MTVIGKRTGSFRDQQTGQEVTFGKLYVVYDAQNVEGQVAESISVKPDLLKDIPVGSEIELYYNKYGRVFSFDLICKGV